MSFINSTARLVRGAIIAGAMTMTATATQAADVTFRGASLFDNNHA